MMSSGSSTDREAGRPESGFQPWHFYLLLSLAGATWAVIVARDTHPAALVLLSAAIVSAGLVGAATHRALISFLGGRATERAPSDRTREFLEQEKALLLRSLKELEFDRAMRKVSDQDFAEIGGRLRARAMEVMERLEGSAPAPRPEVPVQTVDMPAPRQSTPDPPRCPSCDTRTDPDARFCKNCGVKL